MIKRESIISCISMIKFELINNTCFFELSCFIHKAIIFNTLQLSSINIGYDKTHMCIDE